MNDLYSCRWFSILIVLNSKVTLVIAIFQKSNYEYAFGTLVHTKVICILICLFTEHIFSLIFVSASRSGDPYGGVYLENRRTKRQCFKYFDILFFLIYVDLFSSGFFKNYFPADVKKQLLRFQFIIDFLSLYVPSVSFAFFSINQSLIKVSLYVYKCWKLVCIMCFCIYSSSPREALDL